MEIEVVENEEDSEIANVEELEVTSVAVDVVRIEMLEEVDRLGIAETKRQGHIKTDKLLMRWD